MNTYLLLRSNKKSGPYSLDQLINLGLKPYDLVWVEGRSAAWRYPSEVEVLKDYAPASEEQPFDRFYKKPDEERAPARPDIKKEITNQTPLQNITPALQKKVFVSMPGNLAPGFIKKQETKPQPTVSDEKPKPAAIVVNEDPVLESRYTESLEEIKQRYTETYLNRKNKSGWTGFSSTALQVIGGAVFFCVIVVLAYKNFTEEDKTTPKRTIVIQPEQQKPAPVTTEMETPEAIPPVLAETKQELPVETKSVITLPTEIKTKEETKVKKPDAILPVMKNADIDEVKPEANPVAAAEQKTGRKKEQPVDLNKQVFVKANNYKQRAFGGVQNLQLTVSNQSVFILDQVLVELQYLKPSEEPIKVEKIVFNNVAPGGSQTIKIPDYLRGVKVKYKIMSVASSQHENDTAGL